MRENLGPRPELEIIDLDLQRSTRFFDERNYDVIFQFLQFLTLLDHEKSAD